MSRQHTQWAIIFIAVVAAVLFALPAQAQDEAHETFIPLVAEPGRDWYVLDELYSEMNAAGYDPAVVSQHTVCHLHATATPPYDIRYALCNQHYVNGQPTDGTLIVQYWRGYGAMHHVTVTAAQGE